MPNSNKWSLVCYGNGKFVAIDGYSNIFAYSTDGITWTQGTMPSKQSWNSVCYGNDKFVAVAQSTGDLSKVFAYSTDGITWTQGTMPSAQNWNSVCYGNGKFVAIVNSTNVFAYSTNGINWTQGTMPSSQSWYSVCYGNDKFVAVSRGTTTNGSNIFAYSTDGINWTQGTLPSSNYWGYICYGNGKFVVITTSVPRNNVAYSVDGINWTEGTMPSTQYWMSVCYGNGKFVATINDSNVFAYLSTAYYQFSGWNKSDFNITADTSIGGSWSQVSAGGGTNLSELSVGDTFFLGKYQVENETPWPIEWEIVHQESGYQIAMTKQVIDIRPFDGKEPNNPDNDRKNYGNNNWQYSNIEQFLNSDQASWYSVQHQYDAPPTSDNVDHYDNGTTYNAYDTHKGFLYYWSADEKVLLKDMTLTLANNTVTDGSGSYTWTGKVWLPTLTQMGGGQNNSISEGEAFSKFTDNISRKKSLHDMVKANNEYAKVNNSSGNWWYWTSSANPSFSYGVRRVGHGGSIGGNNSAYFGNGGFAPCICIPRIGWSDPSKAPDLNYTT